MYFANVYDRCLDCRVHHDPSYPSASGFVSCCGPTIVEASVIGVCHATIFDPEMFCDLSMNDALENGVDRGNVSDLETCDDSSLLGCPV